MSTARLLTLAALVALTLGSPARAQEGTPAAAPEAAAAEPEAPSDQANHAMPAHQEQVYVGAYINDIQTIDLKLHSYAVDLYVWFRWKNPDLDPAGSVEFVNPSELWGQIKNKNWETPIKTDDGGFYQVLRVQGRFSKKMLLNNYPFDRQRLEIVFEDSVYESKHVTYVADKNPFTLNPKLILPGFHVGTPVMEIEDFRYPTTFGDPRNTEPNTYSRVSLEVPVFRPALTYSMKLLLPVLCVILCAALMFLLKPTYVDARLGIGITSLLTIVALQITLNEDLPDVDYLVLMDKVYIGAYLFVMSGLAVVLRTARMVENDGLVAAVRLHRRALTLLLSAYLLATTYVVISAIVHG